MLGADFLAALVASCFLGAFPPVDFRAVCLVRAILDIWISEITHKIYISLAPLFFKISNKKAVVPLLSIRGAVQCIRILRVVCDEIATLTHKFEQKRSKKREHAHSDWNYSFFRDVMLMSILNPV